MAQYAAAGPNTTSYKQASKGNPREIRIRRLGKSQGNPRVSLRETLGKSLQ